MARVTVVRLGHRIRRDQRLTTHVFLAARALGASEGILCGDEDAKLISGIQRVSALWGGAFTVRYEKSWKKFVEARKNEGDAVAHLTMYGENFEEHVANLRGKNLLVLVGGSKAPREAYEIADYNLSVSTQPHSEVSALALFLDRLFAGKELQIVFDGKMRIVPKKCGKSVIRVRNY